MHSSGVITRFVESLTIISIVNIVRLQHYLKKQTFSGFSHHENH